MKARQGPQPPDSSGAVVQDLRPDGGEGMDAAGGPTLIAELPGRSNQPGLFQAS